MPEILCDAWFRSGALVRLFSLQLETDDAYFLVSRVQDADKPEVTAITRVDVGQFWQRRATGGAARLVFSRAAGRCNVGNEA